MKKNYMYIISSTEKNGEIYYKIGITNNLEKRLKNVKTGNQHKTKLEYFEEVDKTVDINKMENWIHSSFSKNREEGEWFSNLTVNEIRKSFYKYLVK